MNCEYKHCNNKLTGKRTKFCSVNCKVSHHVINNRRKLKLKAIEYKGGKCERPGCDYNKSTRALTFHHLDPSEKDFQITDTATTRNWEKIKAELDKCIMLCANCHAEEHDSNS